MIQIDRRSLTRTLLLSLLALMVGLVIALGEELIFAVALGRSVRFEEADVLAQNGALTAVPFLFLAFRPRLLPWLVAVAATIAVHGWWLATGVAYQRRHSGGGVPLFGAMLMLLSPFAILVVAGALNWAMSRRERDC